MLSTARNFCAFLMDRPTAYYCKIMHSSLIRAHTCYRFCNHAPRAQCLMHGWTNCRDKTTELLDKLSNSSIDYRRCLTSAVLDRVSSVSVDPLTSLQVAQADPAVPGQNEAITTGNNQIPQTLEEATATCTLDGKSKVNSITLLCWKPPSSNQC